MNKHNMKGYGDYVPPNKRRPYKNKEEYENEYAEKIVENIIGEYEDDD